MKKSLEAFRTVVAGAGPILLGSDNFTVVQYVNRQGGTRSATLCCLTWSLLQWCEQNGIRLSARHLAGESNSLADALSRGKKILPSEWTLHQAD